MPSSELKDLRAKLVAPRPGHGRHSEASDPLADFPSESSRRFAWGQKLAGYRKPLQAHLRMLRFGSLHLPRFEGMRLPRVRGLWGRLVDGLVTARPEHLLGGAGVVLGGAALLAVLWIVLLASSVPPVATPSAFGPPNAAALTPAAPEIERVELRPRRTAPRAMREPGDVELPSGPASSKLSSSSSSQRGPAADGRLSKPQSKVDEVVYAEFGSPTSQPTDSGEPKPDPNQVYSADDPGVQPPVPIRPWFFTSPPAGVSRASLSEVEVVVSATGEVASVRMVGGPRTYADSGALSALKTSRFRPALKDRQPVTCRQTVWIKVPER